jgi:methylenetetrahydrofolate reductase (NADPH)
MTYELIPLKNVHDQAAFLPENSTISVTCSPAKTIDDTLDLCATFADDGHTTIPHFAARMVEDEAHVDRIVQRVNEQGIRKVFVVGGDADPRGPFTELHLEHDRPQQQRDGRRNTRRRCGCPHALFAHEGEVDPPQG